MTQVYLKDHRGVRRMSLEAALTPTSWSDGGSMERAVALGEEALGAIGRLLAMLVETGALSLTQAADVCADGSELSFTEPKDNT